MDDPNLTMEEYIRLKEEKDHKRRKVFNWQTATHEKIRVDDDLHDLGSVESEFPAIVFNDMLTSEAALSCALNNDDIDFRNIDSEKDYDKVNMPLFLTRAYVIMEYLVNISKRRAFWSLNEDILKINDSDIQYAVSIKEDTAYPCLHSPKTTKETSSIHRIYRRPIRRIKYIAFEDSGRYQTWCLLQETLIRRIQSLGYAYAGSDTRPPMLDRTDFESWQQRIHLYCLGKDNGVNILKSIDEGPFKMGNFRETLAEGALHLGPERDRVFADHTPEEKERFKADIRATNILLQGLPKDIYTLINHYSDAKDIWDNVKMLLKGSELTKDERESQLYDDFEHFRQNKRETIYEYYVMFTKLINDMRNIKMTMPKMQLNSKFDLASLEYSQETEGPYCTDLPTPDDIRRLLELERVVVDRTIKSQTVSLNPNQILTKELSPDMKQWEELIRENVFRLGGHRDCLPACLAHMLYCVVAEEQYNLAYFFVKRIECARATPTANLPYGMFLTRLYRHVMETYPHLDNGIYDIVERVMRPLVLKQTRRPRSDRGKARHSVSPSSSQHKHNHPINTMIDDDDDVETSRASTPSPTTYLNSLNPLNYQNYQMPSSSEQTDETLFERQTTLLNQTQQMHKEIHERFKSFGKALKGVFSKKKKK
ncbi:hypothetical protein Tco_0566872 [Tanacetum coccineum]